jgi:protein-S-isoprenylcysteine O-methyltransferase Ste14
MAAKAKRPSRFQMLVAVLVGLGLIVVYSTSHKDDTGLVRQLSLPFILGGIVVLIMGAGFGIAFYYHRKRQAEDLERFSARPRD